MGKTDARLHDRTQIPHDKMADNWTAIFGKWEARAPGGEVIGKGKSYEAARDDALSKTSEDIEFEVVRVR